MLVNVSAAHLSLVLVEDNTETTPVCGALDTHELPPASCALHSSRDRLHRAHRIAVASDPCEDNAAPRWRRNKTSR